MVTYRLEYVKCGKEKCHCRNGESEGHGPYWYAYWKVGGKLHKKYVGMKKKDVVLPPSPEFLDEIERLAEEQELEELLHRPSSYNPEDYALKPTGKEKRRKKAIEKSLEKLVD